MAQNKNTKKEKAIDEVKPGGSLWRRFKIYGVGFGIGLLFVILLTENRGCSWLPANRVKNSILERILVVNEASEKQLLSEKINEAELLLALDKGKVLFSESKKVGDFKYYLIKHELKTGRIVTLEFTLPMNSFLSEVHLVDPKKPVNANTSSGTGKVLRYFAQGKSYSSAIFVDETDTNLVRLEKMGYYTSLSLDEIAKNGAEGNKIEQNLPTKTIQSNQVQLKRLDNNFRKSAKIDFQNSNWSANGKPMIAFLFNDEKSKFKCKSELFQDKIKLTEIDFIK
jgi:hypothetical protein